MEAINTMKRYEMKYILSEQQMLYLKAALKDHMEVDQYGKTSIASIYFDTPDDRLIRASLEKPEYKEKIRLRSYGLVKPEENVFLELKRKSEGIVYKRRIQMSEKNVISFLTNNNEELTNDQISKEIIYFKNYYRHLLPKILIIYDRVAYFDKNSDLRVTIDENPRYRLKDLNLHTSMEGESLLNDGGAILEIKAQDSIPLWLTSILSEGKIYQGSFSKVGEAYKKCVHLYA